ncbi:MAG: iron-containing redox enzyme family protein [Nocardioidaceae bacterium]|nr:iron-containing redox enzyme family protein [Nocardioidaceae bacterium]
MVSVSGRVSDTRVEDGEGVRLPSARGPLTEYLFGLLRREADGGAEDLSRLVDQIRAHVDAGVDPLAHEDFQLSLWVLYELHYAGFVDVPDRWEWHAEMLGLRAILEQIFESRLRDQTSETVTTMDPGSADVADALFELVESFASPPLARFVQREATNEQVCEFLIHRSVYHLKESDPAAWVIPRLSGRPKVALAELQYDEFGAGRLARLHSAMFAATLRACGLDGTYGAYLDQVPGLTLATTNAMSLFGLHRRLRGAAVGHLGAFEASSSLPCRRYAAGLRRLGFPEQAAEYFDEHVEADAVHEQLALRDICAGLAQQDPATLPDIAFGAATCLHLEALAASSLLTRWGRHESSLLPSPWTKEAIGA